MPLFSLVPYHSVSTTRHQNFMYNPETCVSFGFFLCWTSWNCDNWVGYLSLNFISCATTHNYFDVHDDSAPINNEPFSSSWPPYKRRRKKKCEGETERQRQRYRGKVVLWTMLVVRLICRLQVHTRILLFCKDYQFSTWRFNWGHSFGFANTILIYLLLFFISVILQC